MPLWTCDIAHCNYPSVRITGDCTLCDRHLCYQHLQPTVHKCPKLQVAPSYDWAILNSLTHFQDDEDAYLTVIGKAEEAEITGLLEKISLSNLAAAASRIRNGIPCEASPLHYDQSTRHSFMGGMNIHVKLQFQDDKTWLARIRQVNATSPPPSLRDYIIKSEVATLRFLEKVAIPTPKVMGYALEGADGNDVGVGYMLIEQLHGQSLGHVSANQNQMRKVMDQLADIYIELSKHPLHGIGSLDLPGTAHIGPIAKEEISDLECGELQLPGPVTTIEDYNAIHVKMILDQILRGEMYVRKPVDAYLIHLFLFDLVPHTASTPNSPCFLKHADEKGDQILVDKDYNITGIIDWEWAYTAPLPVAFNSPIVLFNVANFFYGDVNISDDEKYFADALETRGAGDLAVCVREGRLRHFFSFCCGFDLEGDWIGFEGLFRGLRKTVGAYEDLTWDEWRDGALKKYMEDEGLRVLLEREKQET